MRIPDEKRRCIHQHTSIFLGRYLETRHHGLGEGILDRHFLLRAALRGPECEVLLHQQDPGAVASETHHTLAAQLTAVEPDVIRSHTRRQGIDIEEVLPEVRDFKPHFPRSRVPI